MLSNSTTSSHAILASLKGADDKVTEKAKLFAKDILSGKIDNENEFLRQVKEIYPEIGFYSAR